MKQLSENLFLFEDTCNVYVVRDGSSAALIDFGSGDILDHLTAIGVQHINAILMTHHHRDQGQGLWRAAAKGIPIWVPQVEQELFHSVDEHWQTRNLYNNYNVRQDRFSLREPVPVCGTLEDYGVHRFGSYDFYIRPTPGHTVGSISLLCSVDGKKTAFTGDLIAGPGKIWSLSATQWTYNGAEGVTMSIASLVDLKKRQPDLLLPSHGIPMDNPNSAIDLLVERLRELATQRKQDTRLFRCLDKPYTRITPHLLWNQTSTANSYVLLAKSGKALIVDYGYDFATGGAAGTDRASRRPWLYTMDALKRDFGVKKIDVAVPTHYHDDHVAGLNLLRRVEGTEVWAAQNFSHVLEHPGDYDLPCLWYDPIPVTRVLPLNQAVEWEEYELICYEQPGHTLYAVAIAFEVDGKRVLAIGDQYQGPRGDEWNYVYTNRFRIGDYRRSAELYQKVMPDIILLGHSEPQWVTPEYLDHLLEHGALIERLHRELLPLETVDLDPEGAEARIQPYQVEVRRGECVEFEVEIRNPLPERAYAVVQMVAPLGWQVLEPIRHLGIDGHLTGKVTFQVWPNATQRVRRARVAVDVAVGNRRFGEQAEALVTIL